MDNHFSGATMNACLLSAVAAAGLISTAATAQVSDSIEFLLQGEVAVVCGAFPSNSTANDSGQIVIDFGTLSDANVGTFVDGEESEGDSAIGISYVCNSPGGFTRTITSANNGFLVLDGVGTTDDDRRVPYQVAHGGGSGLSFGFQQIPAAGIVTPLTADFLDVQTGALRFQAEGVTDPATGVPTVFAGDYTDVVTLEITFN